MPLPVELERAARESEDALTRMMDLYDRQLFATIQDIEREIMRLLRELELGPSGNILKTSANLQRAINAWRAATRFASQEVRELGERWTGQFEQVANFVNQNMTASGIPSAFTEVHSQIISVQRELALIDLNSGANLVFKDMGRTLMSETLIGGNFNNLVKQIQSRLSADLLAEGLPMPTGRSLAAQARRIGHDSLMDTYSSIHKKNADDAGINRFLYFGSLVRDSRPWCVQHAMKIYTRTEIQAWNNMTWKGKIPGVDVMIQRGGYNCRHSWQAVPASISAEDLGLAEEAA